MWTCLVWAERSTPDNLTVQSNLDSWYMVFNWCLIVTYSLLVTRPLYDIKAFKIWVILTFKATHNQIWWYSWAWYIWFPRMFNGNMCPNSSLLRDISLPNLSDLEFDLSWSLRWNIITLLDSHMVSYYYLIATYGLYRLLYEISGFKVWVTLTLIFQGHSRSNVIVSLHSAYMLSY